MGHDHGCDRRILARSVRRAGPSLAVDASAGATNAATNERTHERTGHRPGPAQLRKTHQQPFVQHCTYRRARRALNRRLVVRVVPTAAAAAATPPSAAAPPAAAIAAPESLSFAQQQKTTRTRKGVRVRSWPGPNKRHFLLKRTTPTAVASSSTSVSAPSSSTAAPASTPGRRPAAGHSGLVHSLPRHLQRPALELGPVQLDGVVDRLVRLKKETEGVQKADGVLHRRSKGILVLDARRIPGMRSLRANDKSAKNASKHGEEHAIPNKAADLLRWLLRTFGLARVLVAGVYRWVEMRKSSESYEIGERPCHSRRCCRMPTRS
jgi:hypothetical protein